MNQNWDVCASSFIACQHSTARRHLVHCLHQVFYLDSSEHKSLVPDATHAYPNHSIPELTLFGILVGTVTDAAFLPNRADMIILVTVPIFHPPMLFWCMVFHDTLGT